MFSLLCHWLVSCCCLCDLCFPCCVIGWSRAAVYVLCKFLLCYWLVLYGCLCALCFPCCVIGWSVLLSMCFVFSLLCHWLVSCCCLCALCCPCCVIGWSRAAVYVLCVFLAVHLVGLMLLSMCFVFSLLCHWLVSCCCLCDLCFPCCVIGWSRAAVYVICVFLAVSLVGLVLLFMCCVNSCCAIGWSYTVVYVLSIFLTVSLVGLVLLSMCCIFYLLCHWLVSCCCLCALCFPCCVIGWSRAAVYVLCFPCCVIGWSRAAVYVLCVFLAVSLVGLVLLSMCFVFSLLCHWLVSCCCLCALCFPCCVIGWSRAAVYVLCVFLAVSLIGLVLLSMCFVFSVLCHWLVSCCCLCALCFPCCVIGWSRAAVYVLCVFLAVSLVGLQLLSMCFVFLAVSLVGLVLLSMCFVFSLLCHGLVSSCCLCSLCFPCCVIGWSRAAVYVLCVVLAVSLVGLELLSMCFVFSLLCHWLVSCCCLCSLCFPCCAFVWSGAAVYVLCVFLAVSLVGLVLLSM